MPSITQPESAEKSSPAFEAKWQAEMAKGAAESLQHARVWERDRLREKLSFTRYLRAERARHAATSAVGRVLRANRCGGRKPVHTRRRSGSSAHSARASGSRSSDPDPPPAPFLLFSNLTSSAVRP